MQHPDTTYRHIALIGCKNPVGETIANTLRGANIKVSLVDFEGIHDLTKMELRLESVDAVFHLAYFEVLDAPIAQADHYKQDFIAWMDFVKTQSHIKAFITTSFAHIYDSKGIYGESDINYSNNFLAHLSLFVEDAMANLGNSALKTCVLRLPLIVDDGRSLGRLAQLRRFKVGMRLLDMRHYLAWVSAGDLAGALALILGNDGLCVGVVNVVAPTLTRNYQILELLGEKYGKPFSSLPQGLSQKILGNYHYLLTPLRVRPVRLLDAKYDFFCGNMEEAFLQMLKA